MSPRVRSLNTKCIDTMSAWRSSSSLDTSVAPTAAGLLGGQILTPGDDLHAERQCHLATFEPIIPSPMMPERLTREVIAEGVLPSAAAHRSGFGGEMPCACQNQRPGQFDRGTAEIAGMDHLDAARSGRFEVDRGVARRGGGNQFKFGNRSMMSRRSGVRSRMTQTTS